MLQENNVDNLNNNFVLKLNQISKEPREFKKNQLSRKQKPWVESNLITMKKIEKKPKKSQL